MAFGRRIEANGGGHLTAPIFILAGEPSGDRLAASIMHAVNQGQGQQTWIGIGGPAMKAKGLVTDADMDELTVFGFGAALAAYPRLSRLADRLVDRVMAARPAMVLTVDVKGFSLRFAARLKKQMQAAGWTAPIIHTVAPTVWAWGEWRRHRVAQSVDGLLCLFPFEPDYFQPLGLNTQFIGHPEAFNPIYDKPKRPGKGAKLHVTLLPGSRHSELSHILVPMVKAFAIVKERYPDVTATIPTLPRLAPRIEATLKEQAAFGLEVAVRTANDALFTSLAASQAVLAASGTVTLQTALYGVPGVTCYVAPTLSAFIGRRVVNMDRVILPNALMQREVYPFLFQDKATPVAMADALIRSLEDDQAETRAKQTALELRTVLRGGNASFDTNINAALASFLSPQKL